MNVLPNSLRSLRRLLGGQDRFGAQPFFDLSRAYELAHQNVRYFYLVASVYIWLQIPNLHNLVFDAPPLDLAWPLLWATGAPILSVVDALSVACAMFATLAFFKPSNVFWRVGFSLTLIMCAAVPVSIGAVNHGYHELIWLSFIFVFLPRAKGRTVSRSTQLSYCVTFGAAQGLILMFYTMAGFWKVFAGFGAVLRGVPGNFSPDALAWTLADRMGQTNTQPLLGPLMIEHAPLAWPMFMGLMYAQLVAIFIAFRPSLHRLWGWILIAFHTGTWVLMEIAFPAHIAILMMLMLASPFQREPWISWETIRHLPLFGSIYAWCLGIRRNYSAGGTTHALPNL